MSTTAEPVSVRRELTDYIRSQYEAEDELSSATLVDRCYKHFSADSEFLSLLALEAVRLIVPTLGNEVRHEMRAHARNGQGAETPRERFARVFGYVGGDNSKSFLAMRRPEHIFAAENLELQAKGTLCRAGIHRAAAALHEDDDRTTGEILNDHQLEFLERTWLECDAPPVPWLTK